ncbi:hypothetical protein Bca101_064231 [Brassica carinata]
MEIQSVMNESKPYESKKLTKAWIYESPQKKLKRHSSDNEVDRLRTLHPEPEARTSIIGENQLENNIRSRRSSQRRLETLNRREDVDNYRTEHASGKQRQFKALDTSPFTRAGNSKDISHLNKDEAGHINCDTSSGTKKHRGADCESTPINMQLGQLPCLMLKEEDQIEIPSDSL